MRRDRPPSATSSYGWARTRWPRWRSPRTSTPRSASCTSTRLDASGLAPRGQVSSMEGVTGLTVSTPYGGCRVLSGSPHVTDRVEVALGSALEQAASGAVAVRRHVLAFFQGNRFLAARPRRPRRRAGSDRQHGRRSVCRRRTIRGGRRARPSGARDGRRRRQGGSRGSDRPTPSPPTASLSMRCTSQWKCSCGPRPGRGRGDRRSAEDRPVARGARRRRAPGPSAVDLCLLRRRHTRSRRPASGRRRLSDGRASRRSICFPSRRTWRAWSSLRSKEVRK